MVYIDKRGNLSSDSGLGELHEFAHKVGLKRESFRPATNGCGGLPFAHYILSGDWMRYKAVKYGAVPVASRGTEPARPCGQLSFQV